MLAFFTHETVVWKCLQHDPANFVLRGMIGLRHEVARALRGGLESADPFTKHPAARPGSGFTDSQWIGRRMHDGLQGLLET
jgi:hypothetical protein